VLWIAFALAPNGFGIVAWILWAVVAIGTWIHHPISLTTIRCLAPIAVFYSAVYALSESLSSLNIAVVTCGIISLMLMYTADYGSAHVQAGAYGNERRFLLRIPAPVVLPTLITWALFATVLVVLENAVQSENYVLGIPLLLALIAMSWKFAPQMHRLSKRWLVRVPAGWVVHDDLMLAENLLLRTHNITAIQLAPADTEAIDLSGITQGIPLEISLREMTDVRLTPLLSKVTKTVDALHVKQLMVTPSQAQRVLSI